MPVIPPRQANPNDAPGRSGRPRVGLELLALALLAAGALVLRLWRLDTLPPGLHFDEAAYGLLAEDVRAGHPRLFFREFTGREPLYIYLVALAQTFLGSTALAERLPAAVCGAASIPATFWALRELFHGEGATRARRIAWLGALALAASFWSLHTSRQGERANLVPLVGALAVAATWRAARLRSRPWLVAAGLLGGLTPYTYLAARFLPLLPLAFAAYGWLRWRVATRALRRGERRRRWRALVAAWRGPALVWCGAALLAAAPLGLYFLLHPGDLAQRAGQVGVFGRGGLPQLGRNLLDALRMLVLTGSGDLKYTLPGRPVFDPLAAPFFLVGVGLCARRAPRRAPYAFLLLWWGALILPAVLSVEGNHPLRAYGVIPAVMGIWAVGCAGCWEALARRVRGGRPLGAAVAAAILGVALALTCRDYFDRWAHAPGLYGAMDGEYADLAAYLNTLPDDGAPRVIAAEELRYPTIAYLAPRSRGYGWVDPSQALVIPAAARAGGRLDYLVPDRVIGVRGVPDDWAAPLGPPRQVAIIRAPGGRILGKRYVFQLPPGAGLVPAAAPRPCDGDATFADDLTLLAWQPAAGSPGGTLPLTLYWEARRPSAAQWQVFVHLVAAPDAPRRLAQQDANGAFTRGLAPGDLVIGRYRLPLEGVPPGDYALQVGLYDLDDPRHPRASLTGRECATTVRRDSVILTPVPILP